MTASANTTGDLIAYILNLEEQSAETARLLRQAKEELLHRERDAISSAYAAKADQFGTIHLDAERFDVEINTPRRVEWDQERLAAIEIEIRDQWKADAGEYIDRKLSVKESKYKAWPSDLKARFEPARLVKPGSQSITITVKE